MKFQDTLDALTRFFNNKTLHRLIRVPAGRSHAAYRYWHGPWRFSGYQLMMLVVLLIVPMAAHADHYKVFLFGGQSNMDGRAKPDHLPESYQQPQKDVLFSHNKYFGPLKPNPGFGPELSFGRTVADAFPDSRFVMIKYAAGGTDLYEDWAVPDGKEYVRFQSRVKAGLNALEKAGHTYQIAGMVWVQGESDAVEGRTTEQYEEDLNNFIATMRSNYGKDLPFFFNRLGTNQKRLRGEPFNQISTAQENVAESDDKAYIVLVDDLGMKDGVHFDARGTLTLGERLANAYVNTVPESK